MVFLVVATCLPENSNGSGERAQQTSVTPAYAPSVSPPPTVTSTLAQPSKSAKPSQKVSAKPVRVVVRPATPTWLVIKTAKGRVLLQTAIGQQAAPINPDGTWGKMDPPYWNRAVWETQSVMPAYPSPGTSAIYGHACHHHVCSFDKLATVQKGDTATLTTPSGVLTYRVDAPGQYPKEGSGSLGSKHSVANELMLVTCAYEQGDESLNNLVVTAKLVAAERV